MRKWPCQSWLISTVENEHFLEKGKQSDADALILELEAGTVDKTTARMRLEDAVKSLRETDKYLVARINPIETEAGHKDLEYAVRARPDAIMLTKVATAEEVRHADEMITQLERTNGLPVGHIELALMIELARAIFTAVDMPAVSSRVKALCFGGGDYTTDIHTRMSLGTGAPVMPGLEILVPRSLVVAAARANDISPIDVPHLNVLDDKNFRLHAYESRALGFDGIIALHPRQIPLTHEAFMPTLQEIADAKDVVARYAAAVKEGKGVIGVRGEMISKTSVEWYQEVLDRAGLSS